MRTLALSLLAAGLLPAAVSRAADPLPPDSPQVFFFRSAEGTATRKGVTYEQWDATFSRLSGIMGKVLDEELPGREARNIDFFTRFKKEHPDQLVMLHFNGDACLPTFTRPGLFAGHWLYYNGATLTEDIPAQTGQTLLHVSNPHLFILNGGTNRRSSDDIGLCALGPDGKPDWSHAEQVHLLEIDNRAKTLLVQRGCLGTQPIALKAGQGYAAAHCANGPIGKSTQQLWQLNYAVGAPKDAQGRSCADALAQMFEKLYAPGGDLAAFDGLQFDVLFNTAGGGRRRQPDCDADGQGDSGIVNGVNIYGIGVTEYLRQLRQRLGPQRIIQADGMSNRNQRGFTILNGMESEGFPDLHDLQFADWSSGINRLRFWVANSFAPQFSYINHKARLPGADGAEGAPIPISSVRLVFAAAMMSDAAITFADAPPPEGNELTGVWDELWMGDKHRLGWLGQPTSAPVHLAAAQSDLLGDGATPAWWDKVQSDDAQSSPDDQSLKLQARDAAAASFTVRVPFTNPTAGALWVSMTLRADPMTHYPPQMARLVRVSVVNHTDAGDASGGGAEQSTMANAKPFAAGFYFPKAPAGDLVLQVQCESGEPVWIDSLSVHAGPDVMVRSYQHGLVLANPSPEAFTFNLAHLFPGQRFHHLTGSPKQDPRTNDGSAVGNTVTLSARDGLFLLRDE